MAQMVGVFRIGRDAEVRFTQGGDPVASLSLAFNYGKKQEDGKRPSQWIDASLWGKRAEAMAPYLKKGGMVYCVISDPHIETFQGKNGEGVKLAGSIMEIEFAGGKQDGGGRQEQSAPAPQQSRPAQQSRGGGGGSSFEDMDSDIPFTSSSVQYDIESPLDRKKRRRT